jgi:anti-sigma-K factor RskA
MNRGHDRFKEQLPALALGALDPGERKDLEHHLEGCAECRAELAWLEPARDVLAADVEQVEPSPGLRARVMAEVDADLGVSSPEPGPVARPVRKRRGWLAEAFRPLVIGAAAVALVIGIGLGIALNGDDSPSGPPQQQVVTGQSTNGAEAVMVASEGTGTLKMTGLKRPDQGQVYQAWIQRGQSVLPTDSLFVPDRNGSATASIPDLGGVSAVMVSVEPRGGSPQPTTAPVITVSMPG